MNKSIQFKVKENTYTLSIPTIGQLRDIENQKALLAQNNYSGIMNSYTRGSNFVLDSIDMIAYLSVLCKDLIKDLRAPILELEIFDLNELKTAYAEQVVPWINEWQAVLMPDENDASALVKEEGPAENEVVESPIDESAE